MSLRALLLGLKNLNPEHPLVPKTQMVTYDEEGGGVEIKFHKRALEGISRLSDSSISTVCSNFLTAVKGNDLTASVDALRTCFDSQSMRQARLAGSESDSSEDLQQRVLGSGCKDAFNYPYEHQPLEAFEEYLDIQWLEMCRLFDSAPNDGEGTRHSRCGSIIQSSCTGKSRLIQE